MGKPTGFLEHTRALPSKRSVAERVHDYYEFVNKMSDIQLNQQSSRCMNCGVPYRNKPPGFASRSNTVTVCPA